MPNQTLVFASGGVEPVPEVSHLQELLDPLGGGVGVGACSSLGAY